MIDLKLNKTEAENLLKELEVVIGDYDALIEGSEIYSDKKELEKTKNNLHGIFKRLKKAKEAHE